MGKSQQTALRLVHPDLSHSDYTFQNLDDQSNQFANLLATLEIQKGDVVCILLPKQLEVFTSFFGILKNRSVACILFSNFGEEAILERLKDSGARILVTKKSLYQRIQNSLSDLPALSKVLLTDLMEDVDERVLSYTKWQSRSSTAFEVADTDPETPSVLHYTSGSTGRPKGVLHVHGAIDHILRTMDEIFQVQPEDMYWCTADQAWVTGVSYGIVGPWAKGLTQIHYTGKYDAAVWFEILSREKVTIWYTAPTALRMLMQDEQKILGKFDLPLLDRVYSVGEPLNPEIITWVRRVMQKEIYDTWFQTETGGVMISNRPGLEVRPGSMGKPLDGISAIVVDEEQTGQAGYQVGNLRIKKGWPSMFRTYLNMQSQYQQKFLGDFYDTGDRARIDPDGYFWFLGRNDDIINTSGHLVGPFEVESSLLEVDEIIDVAVIAAPDPLLYEKIVAFVKIIPGSEWSKSLEIRCRIHVSKQLSPIAVPSEFVITDKIPKNRSGKIMRRVLKAQYLGQDTGDLSTLEE